MIFTEKIFNVETQTETIIEREATLEEIKKVEELEKALKAEAAEKAIRETARQALLDKLGITADEAKLLLG